MIIACIICNNDSELLVTKGKTDYYQCNNCKTVFCSPLDNDNLVGGEFEQERNDKENVLRLSRIDEIVSGVNKDNVNILDFGCGHGLLIDYLKENGYKNTDGYDAYYEPYSKLPEKNKYHVVNATEVFEHLSPPFFELDVINRSLLLGGSVIVETSFTNVAEQEGIPIKDFFYLNPDAGHSILYSHHSLDLLMMFKGFIPQRHFNRHVRHYKKIK